MITFSPSVLSPTRLFPKTLGLSKLVGTRFSAPQIGSGMLIVIDPSVDHREALAAGVISGATLLMLDEKKDAIAQITKAIRRCRGALQSLHIVTHGSPGTLHFSSGDLTSANLHLYAEHIESWFGYEPLCKGSTIKVKGAQSFISLYACNLATGAAGMALLENLSYLTGVNIHASEGKVGSTDVQGSWQLEVALPFQRPTKFPFTNDLLETYEAVI